MTAGSALAIVNARGIPGTAACVARDLHDGRPVLLTTHHVLFGGGAREGEPVWLLDEYHARHQHAPLGRALWGKTETISVDGEPCYVDCAIASWAGRKDHLFPSYPHNSTPRVGETVAKTGAASGRTTGVIDQLPYLVDQGPMRHGLRAPGQMLVRSRYAGQAFADSGDSGALVLNDERHALGLLWGVNARGDGLASPMAAVLRALNISLEQPTQ